MFAQFWLRDVVAELPRSLGPAGAVFALVKVVRLFLNVRALLLRGGLLRVEGHLERRGLDIIL